MDWENILGLGIVHGACQKQINARAAAAVAKSSSLEVTISPMSWGGSVNESMVCRDSHGIREERTKCSRIREQCEKESP